MSSVEVSINQLPVINQVTEGDFLIIQTPNATNRLNFSDFVVGLDNTTFKNTRLIQLILNLYRVHSMVVPHR